MDRVICALLLQFCILPKLLSSSANSNIYRIFDGSDWKKENRKKHCLVRNTKEGKK